MVKTIKDKRNVARRDTFGTRLGLPIQQNNLFLNAAGSHWHPVTFLYCYRNLRYVRQWGIPHDQFHPEFLQASKYMY